MEVRQNNHSLPESVTLVPYANKDGSKLNVFVLGKTIGSLQTSRKVVIEYYSNPAHLKSELPTDTTFSARGRFHYDRAGKEREIPWYNTPYAQKLVERSVKTSTEATLKWIETNDPATPHLIVKETGWYQSIDSISEGAAAEGKPNQVTYLDPKKGPYDHPHKDHPRYVTPEDSYAKKDELWSKNHEETWAKTAEDKVKAYQIVGIDPHTQTEEIQTKEIWSCETKDAKSVGGLYFLPERGYIADNLDSLVAYAYPSAQPKGLDPISLPKTDDLITKYVTSKEIEVKGQTKTLHTINIGSMVDLLDFKPFMSAAAVMYEKNSRNPGTYIVEYIGNTKLSHPVPITFRNNCTNINNQDYNNEFGPPPVKTTCWFTNYTLQHLMTKTLRGVVIKLQETTPDALFIFGPTGFNQINGFLAKALFPQLNRVKNADPNKNLPDEKRSYFFWNKDKKTIEQKSFDSEEYRQRMLGQGIVYDKSRRVEKGDPANRVEWDDTGIELVLPLEEYRRYESQIAKDIPRDICEDRVIIRDLAFYLPEAIATCRGQNYHENQFLSWSLNSDGKQTMIVSDSPEFVEKLLLEYS